MSSEATAANYLRDFGGLVRELALGTKAQYEQLRDSEDGQFLLGRLGAFHEIVSLMQQQADAFGLNLGELSLDGLDPDRDLL